MHELEELHPKVAERMITLCFSVVSPPPVQQVVSLTTAQARRLQRTMQILAIDTSPHKAAEVVIPEPSTPEDAAKFPHKYWEG